MVASNLAELPRGEQTFAGVRFQIGDAFIQLRGQCWPEQPKKVAGIEVGKTFEKLYIFHGGGTLTDIAIGDGWVIGHYDVEYEDGTRQAIPIVWGETVREWWKGNRKPLSRAKLGWEGTNPRTRLLLKSIRLYLTMWENPHPDKRVGTIDFVSTGIGRAAPFCVAMTMEGTAARKAAVLKENAPADSRAADGEAAPGKDE